MTYIIYQYLSKLKKKTYELYIQYIQYIFNTFVIFCLSNSIPFIMRNILPGNYDCISSVALLLTSKEFALI